MRRGVRVLHLGFEDPAMPGAGGGSVRTREINRRLAAGGMELTVLTTRYPGCVDETRDGVRYEHVGIGRGANRLTRLLGYLAVLPGQVRRRDADLVVEDFIPPFSSAAVPLWTRRPVVGMVQWLHAREKTRQYKVPVHLVERVAVRTHRRLIAVSRATAVRLAQLSPRAQVDVIGNGVDRALLEEPARPGRDILCIGRLELGGKGLDLLLTAWAQVQDRVDGDLVIAGTGPDDERVRQFAARLGLGDRVRFVGWVGGREKTRLLAASRLVVVPSRAETFGMVAVEALAAATPVVAFDIPALREVVPPGCGRLVPAFDVDALAAALVDLSGDEELLIAAGKQGRAFAENYDWDALAEQQARVYRDAVAAPGGPRVTSPAPREVWAELVARDPQATPSQTPAWTDWLCRTRGYTDASRLYEFPDGRRLVLPLLASGPGGRVSEESMPYGFGYGGPLVDGGRPTSAEAAAVLDDLARRPVLRASLTPSPLVADVWDEVAPPGAVRVPYLAHVLDLDGGFDEVWSKRFRSGMRRNIRLAGRNGLEISTDRDGVVAVFAELNRRSVDRWAAQRGQPLWLAHLVERRRDRTAQLASALSELGPMVSTWTAHRNGEPVAATVTLRCGEQVWFWMSAMDKDLAHRTHAGALLQSLAIEEACRVGARWFQLGESDADSGVSAFKERLGGRPVHYNALRLERLPVTAAERSVRTVVGRLTSRGSGRTT